MGEGDVGGADTTYTQDQLDAKIAEANKALEAKRAELLDEVKTLKRRYDGIDPDEYRQVTQRLSELEQQQQADQAGLSSEELAKLRQDVAADIRKQFESNRDAGLEAFSWARELADENRALKLDAVVKAEMAKGGARAERIDALFKLTQERFQLTSDGKPVLRDHPATELSKYVADELRTEYPEFYNGSGSSGGGASKSTASGGGYSQKIAADDQKGFIDNLEAIADGTMEVVM